MRQFSKAQKLTAFAVLVAPFILNDFAFIALDGGYGVYLVDYATRVLVLGICLLWPVARHTLVQPSQQAASFYLAFAALVALVVAGRLLTRYVEPAFDGIADWGQFFRFGPIENQTLRWFDLTAGLLLVALSEELVFRKFALAALSTLTGKSSSIILFSAIIFALIHWAGGIVKTLMTFLFGVVYMAVYLKIGRLWPLVAAHWIENWLQFSDM